MGGSHSSKITVVNDEKENAISVTSGVVERIKEETPTTVVEEPPVRKEKTVISNEHYKKLAERNEELIQLLLKDIVVSEVPFTDGNLVITPKICFDKQQATLNCLRLNRDQPLNCSTEMAAFTRCIYCELDGKTKNIV